MSHAVEAWKRAHTVTIEVGRYLFRIRPVSSADMAREGWAELSGSADVGAALRAATDDVYRTRANESADETALRQQAEAAQALDRLFAKPESAALIEQRMGAIFRAGCIGFGARLAPVATGASALLVDPTELDPDDVAPIRWVADHAGEDDTATPECVHESLVDPLVRLGVAMAIETLGRGEAAERALKTFRGGT